MSKTFKSESTTCRGFWKMGHQEKTKSIEERMLAELKEIKHRLPSPRWFGTSKREYYHREWLNSDEYVKALQVARSCVKEQERIQKVVPAYYQEINEEWTDSCHAKNLAGWMQMFFQEWMDCGSGGGFGLNKYTWWEYVNGELTELVAMQTVEQIENYINNL